MLSSKWAVIILRRHRDSPLPSLTPPSELPVSFKCEVTPSTVLFKSWQRFNDNFFLGGEGNPNVGMPQSHGSSRGLRGRGRCSLKQNQALCFSLRPRISSSTIITGGEKGQGSGGGECVLQPGIKQHSGDFGFFVQIDVNAWRGGRSQKQT